MDECHSSHQGNHTRHHDLVLGEKLLDANIAPTNPDCNDSQGQNGHPPAGEEDRMSVLLSLAVWRDFRIDI